MRNLRVIDVNFAPQDDRLRLDIVGLPNECMEKADTIADAMFGYGEWIYISVEGRRQSGATLASDFGMKIVAERVLGK